MNILPSYKLLVIIIIIMDYKHKREKKASIDLINTILVWVNF